MNAAGNAVILQMGHGIISKGARLVTPNNDDGAKQIKGRKQHLLANTQGPVLTATVHPADVMDRDGVTLRASTSKTKSIPNAPPAIKG